MYITKIDVRLESFMRTLGVFLTVFFTIRWGAKSPINDELWITVASILGVILGFRTLKMGWGKTVISVSIK